VIVGLCVLADVSDFVGVGIKVLVGTGTDGNTLGVDAELHADSNTTQRIIRNIDRADDRTNFIENIESLSQA